MAASAEFATAWEKADTIDGWLSRGEALALFQAANSIPPDGQIVEIGSFRGRSATLLAQTGRKVIAIDPLIIGRKVDNYVVSGDHEASLRKVTDEFPNVRWWRCKSTDAQDIPPIDLLYIDGDHQGDAPLKDFRHFRSRLKPEAIVAFHDYGQFPKVSSAVHQLEKEGVLRRAGVYQSMYIGRIQEAGSSRMSSKLLFLARPSYGHYEPESDYAAHHAVSEDSPLAVHTACFRLSMTCKNCNDLLARCLNIGGYDYFAMLHADEAPDAGWLDTQVQQMEEYGFDVIHSPAAFKNDTGITKTAIGYSDNIWAPVRRITTTELQSLPDTFGLQELRDVYDPDAERILPSTGCMVVKLGDWINDFPGFAMEDRMFQHNGDWHAVSVSEDYMFGHWCARNGLKLGVTKITVGHYGRWNFSTADAWGAERDEEYYRDVAAVREAQVA